MHGLIIALTLAGIQLKFSLNVQGNKLEKCKWP